MGRITVSGALILAAVVVFVLAVLRVEVSELDTLRMMALGLMFFAAAHLLP